MAYQRILPDERAALAGKVSYVFLSAAMGISSSIWQCRRKCCPMLVLQWQKKNCCRKGFCLCGHPFQVLLCLIIPEIFNLVYN